MGETRHFLLVRHGETAANAQGIIQGQLQTGLSEAGLRQARCVAERLARWMPAVGRVLSSDLLRAVQTAEQIAAACRARVECDPAWREASAGILEGKTNAEYIAWFREHGPHAVPPGAESGEGFDRRVHQAMRDLPGRGISEGAVVVVSHGGPICTVYRLLLQGRLPLIARSARPVLGGLRNCSIMHLLWHLDEEAWELRCVNDAAHLDG